jgi:hypothetical protein
MLKKEYTGMGDLAQWKSAYLASPEFSPQQRRGGKKQYTPEVKRLRQEIYMYI